MIAAVLAIVPCAGVLFLFVVAVRAMLEGDRRERAALARWEAQNPGSSQEKGDLAFDTSPDSRR